MNETERFVLPGLPPTTNMAYKVAGRDGHGVMYKTTIAKEWQTIAGLVIGAGRIQPHQDWANCNIGVQFTFWCKNESRDIDGGVKLALDAVAIGLDFNDKQVTSLVVYKAKAMREEETDVWVYDVERGND